MGMTFGSRGSSAGAVAHEHSTTSSDGGALKMGTTVIKTSDGNIEIPIEALL